jgi:RimJ/RimL family protein N-acetyltransferase
LVELVLARFQDLINFMKKKKYNTFISGETIDLVIPDMNAIKYDNWPNWFNDEDTTRFLGSHGYFINTIQNQKNFLKKALEKNISQTGLFLLIKPKNINRVVGIISFSKIDLINRVGELALVLNKKKIVDENFFYYGFESKALMTIHGFEKLNLLKIKGGQALALSEWQKFSVLFGYKPDGISKNNFVKNLKTHDVIYSSCDLEDYKKMKMFLGGKIWPGKKIFFNIIKKFPKKNIYEEINKLIELKTNSYLKLVKKSLKNI